MPSVSHHNPIFDLNTEQMRAVHCQTPRILVLAGAGSGKTRVLVQRIAHLITHQQVPPQQILAVTFTNKAAREMRERLLQAIGQQASQAVWLGTFHSICHRILRAHAASAGLPQQFSIVDSDDQMRLVRRIMKELRIAEEYLSAKQARDYISKKKEAGLRFTDLPPARDLYTQTLYSIFEQYEKALQRNGQVDFADLLLKVHEIWNQDSTILAGYQARFEHVLVDEFQDTNPLQYRWLKRIALRHLFAVGDDDQSIYSWRGAQSANLALFKQDYPDASEIKLEENYRSSHRILQASNALIKHNSERFDKTLWTKSQTGDPIFLYRARSDLEEARFVASQIGKLRNTGHSLSDCAILYRSNVQSRLLEEALLQAKLPYRIFGGLRFFERAEIKDVLAYLRLLMHPEDDVAFERIVNWPTRGIGEQTLLQLREAALQLGTGLLSSARHVLSHPQIYSNWSKRALGPLQQFADLIDTLQKSALDQSLTDTLQEILQTTQLAQQWAKMKDGKAQERTEHMGELLEASRNFLGEEDEHGISPVQQIENFLAHAALESGDHQAHAPQDSVQMMTIHSAKGLEFSTVFLVGLEEGLFPHHMALQEDNVEEERRLCYVAMTRAKARLFLTHATVRRLYGSEKYNAPSRFLKELPAECLESLSAGAPARNNVPTHSSPPAAHRVLFPSPPTDSSLEFNLGDKLLHTVFGEGVLLAMQGTGKQQRGLVAFGNSGQKWLLLAQSPVEKIL